MSSAVAEPARVVRSSPGRVRVHLPGWSGTQPAALERRLQAVSGVMRAEANPRTANVLIRHDPAVTDAAALVVALGRLEVDGGEIDDDDHRSARPPPHVPPALREGRRGRRLRIAVRGLDRDTDLARRVVERLERRPEVARAIPSQLTGRVLVELAEVGADLGDVLADISDVEPELTGHDDVPGHPLDPAPLVQGTARLIGAALGIGLLALRRTVGATGAPVSAGGPAAIAGTVGIVEGLPQLGRSVEGRLGRDATQLLFGALTIAGLTSSGGTLGLAVAGASALGLVTEVRARQAAWRGYEERIGSETSAHPGAVMRLERGGRAPLAAEVLEGFGRAVGADGATVRAAPGARLAAGARVYGPGVTVRLAREPPFPPSGRRAPPPRSHLERYLEAIVPFSLAFGAVLGVLRRSPRALFTGLLLVNPRAALTGVEQADSRASARALRCGVTVVGTRRRPLLKPDILLIASARAVTDGLEVGDVTALGPETDTARLLDVAAAVAAAAGSPWGPAFRASGRVEAVEGSFDGGAATAEIDGVRWTLGPAAADDHAAAARARAAGEEPLLLAVGDGAPMAVVSIRPRPAAGIRPLMVTCARRDVRLAVVTEAPSAAAVAVARRAGIRMLDGAPLHERVDEEQRHGATVAVLADAADAARAFEIADLAIALTSGRSGPLPARADLLAPNLTAVADIVDTGARRDVAVRDSVLASIAANAAGAVWGLGGAPRVRNGSSATYVGTLAAIAAGWRRLRGGHRSRSVAERLLDPEPERWGRLGPDQVVAAVGSRRTGLTDAEAAERWRPRPRLADDGGFAAALAEQARSPLIGALAAGAGLSLAIGAIADAALIGAVILANAAIGAWQQGKAGRAAEALERMTVHTATVLRGGRQRTVAATDVVRGDIVVLGPGARVPADARLLDADALEVDEAALTGESLPVSKRADGGDDAARVLLDGSDVVAGNGRAVVVATGPDTRLGSLAAALGLGEPRESPLDRRLQEILRQATPLIAVASGLVLAGGLARGAQLVPQLALAASVAIAAVPEGLPLLAGLASAAVARRLASRNALVRRLAAVESFGRVDVACADKTGTITEGRLAVRLVAGLDGPGAAPEHAGDAALAEILLAAALASPHPQSAHAGSHPTDVAVLQAAERAGLDGRLRARRTAELPFEASRGFHAAVVEGRLVIKGATEQLVTRCSALRRESGDVPLRPPDREMLLARADRLAAGGLRVLMIAEGAPASAGDPRDLVALGFVGIADPLRATVPAAVQRCHDAGVRVVMLTGDHAATARAIGRAAGLSVDGDSLLTGPDIAALDDDELSARLERASVVARITPLDKVRIVEALQRAGHVVAMTGDGVNDAPALRLADVGVAMGRAGTQVARESADVVLADDDFSTLVEVLVEGRGFWANMRRSLAVLLGGNLGELGLMVGASIAGLPSPLTTRQVLTVNLVTDVLPAVAVAVQEPEHRDLGRLAREGATGLDAPLRTDILRRGIATAVPSLGAYIAAQRISAPRAARSVAFASVIATQLAHTADLGRIEGRMSGQLLGAIGASAAFTAAALVLPGVQGFLGLATPSLLGAGLVVAATAAAVALARGLSLAGASRRPPVGGERASHPLLSPA